MANNIQTIEQNTGAVLRGAKATASSLAVGGNEKAKTIVQAISDTENHLKGLTAPANCGRPGFLTVDLASKTPESGPGIK